MRGSIVCCSFLINGGNQNLCIESFTSIRLSVCLVFVTKSLTLDATHKPSNQIFYACSCIRCHETLPLFTTFNALDLGWRLHGHGQRISKSRSTWFSHTSCGVEAFMLHILTGFCSVEGNAFLNVACILVVINQLFSKLWFNKTNLLFNTCLSDSVKLRESENFSTSWTLQNNVSLNNLDLHSRSRLYMKAKCSALLSSGSAQKIWLESSLLLRLVALFKTLLQIFCWISIEVREPCSAILFSKYVGVG